MTFDPVASINLVIYILATFGAAAGVYYGIRGDIRDLRKDIQTHKSENDDAHSRIETDIRDHEVRLRVLELGGPR